MKYVDCRYFELIKSKSKDELDRYYCWHKKNEGSECEYASCTLNKPANYFEEEGG